MAVEGIQSGELLATDTCKRAVLGLNGVSLELRFISEDHRALNTEIRMGDILTTVVDQMRPSLVGVSLFNGHEPLAASREFACKSRVRFPTSMAGKSP